MSAPVTSTGALTRRSVMVGLGSMMGLRPAFSADKPGLHERVAEHVRALAKGKSVTLRFLLPKGSGPNLDPVIRAFTQACGVALDVHEVPVDDINTELTLQTLSNRSNFDLALPATFGIPDLVSVGALLNLDDLAQRYEPPGFRSGILYRAGDRFDNRLFGFQTDGDAYLMFYNAPLLEDPDEQARYEDLYGTPLQVPRIWQELDRQMAFFHRPDQGLYGGLLFRTPGYLAWEWWVRLHAKGIWPFSPDMEPQIDSEAGVLALEEMVRATESLCPEVDRLGLFQNWERYSKGDIYCNIGWGGSQKFLNSPRSPMRGRMLYGPTPGGMVDGTLLLTPYFNWGWNLVVTNGSTQPELAYLFALFAASPEMSTLAVRQVDGYFDPFRAEHYEDPEIRAIYSDDFLKVHRSSLESAVPDLYLMNRGEYMRVLSKWLHRAILRDVTPAAALTRVSQHWRMITGRAGLAEQKQRWTNLRSAYPANIRDRLRDLS